MKHIQHLTYPDAERWYVLNYLSNLPRSKTGSAESCINLFNKKQNSSLQVFEPTFAAYVEKNGRREKIDRPLAFHYVFVKGNFFDVKKLCGEPNSFSFVLNRCADDRYAVIDDTAMESFKKIALRYSNAVPFYSLEGVNLEDCDKVEVVEGDFPGLIGYYMPNVGRGSGRIILRLTQGMGTVAYDINARYIRILEFSKNFNRAYDFIDDFTPRLYTAMRTFYSGTNLSEKELSDLNSFCRRLGKCRLDSPKIEAKLQAMLLAAYRMLGDEDEAKRVSAMLEKTEKSVTAPATKAFINLLDAVCDHDEASFLAGLEILRAIDGKDSKSLRALRSEYDHYIGTETFLFPH